MERPRIRYVYVAGPITHGDVLLNLRTGILAGRDLLTKGYAPYVPHFDYSLYMLDPETANYERLLMWDFDWIRKCDALVRLPGYSNGADREVEFATSIGVPIFYGLEALYAAG